MKSYTSLEQSKKLAEFLSLESADMCYPLPCEDGDKPLLEQGGFGSTPCWSLAALLSIIPDVSLNSFKDGSWNVMTSQTNDGKMIYADKKDPVDACYEMILKLYELKML